MGQTAHLKEITNRFCKYFKDCTVLSGDTVSKFCYQIGEGGGGNDHGYWGPPETQESIKGSRKAFWTSSGASDIAAEYAAALAVNYLNFGNAEDLKYAEALYKFSTQYNQCATDGTNGFYTSDTYEDDQAWAAGFLYLATKDDKYKNFMDNFFATGNRQWGEVYTPLGWSNAESGAAALYGEIAGDWKWANSYVSKNCTDKSTFWMPSWASWGSARTNTAMQLVAMVISKHTDNDYSDWCKAQMGMILGFTYSHMYKEIQTGVRQEIVYGEKHRKGHSLMPSLEYSKRGLFIKGLDVALTANYNKNATTNIDTASYKYNWLGDRKLMNSPGEQSNQYSRADNNNWNGTLTVNYRLAKIHMLTFNHVLNTFRRSNTSLLAKMESEDAIAKETHKNISGLSYRLMPSDNWNLSVFGKYYSLYVAGPMATTMNQDDYVRTTRNMNSIGYGAAGTYFILPGLQAKLSYEKAYRLPTIEEMFGDEDLEMGDISIKPESSDNLNFNLSYNRTFGRHSVYMEGGVIYRNTKDYIQRNIADLSGGKYAAKYINYGKVLTKGYTVSARYGFGNWVSIGGNFTKMDVRDNMRTSISSSAENLAYKERMPNLPYMFADSDVTFYWRDLGRKGNMLTVSYDNQYLHSFTYYSSRIGSNKGDYVVPDQFSHNISFSYSLQKGRYNVSLECRNFTDEKLYDNFSLQKAGRAFYGKLRVCFGN